MSCSPIGHEPRDSVRRRLTPPTRRRKLPMERNDESRGWDTRQPSADVMRRASTVIYARSRGASAVDQVSCRLRGLGYHTIFVAGGEAALQILSQQWNKGPALLLADHELGDMSAAELLQRSAMAMSSTGGSKAARVPIAVLAPTAQRSKLLSLGADCVLHRPLGTADLGALWHQPLEHLVMSCEHQGALYCEHERKQHEVREALSAFWRI
eukprot:CAMPEP_0119322598 /NCGR_PEP_ID=MMETSP1333-20130426/58657_1 /TAXON_ID=418940 /ORGANISM="Scyphosphaera apsteinii, Strain RCC1455" /LENGTH=210 /DNA_ID=CAMNT_0007329865 /DNA_START=15 /DNA_END=647 /DNA_ORIENTATION=-